MAVRDEVTAAKEYMARKKGTVPTSVGQVPAKETQGGTGRYPIRNRQDLENAIRAVGRSKTPAATKAWIKRRAAALGLTALIPAGW